MMPKSLLSIISCRISKSNFEVYIFIFKFPFKLWNAIIYGKFSITWYAKIFDEIGKKDTCWS